MTATGSNRTHVAVPNEPDEFERYVEPEGRGWLLVAGIILGVAGAMRIIDAIWAFGYKGDLPENLQDGVLGDDLTTYAWTWLIVGIVMIVSGVMVVSRSQFARWVGFFAAAVGCITAMVWMPYYPVWSLTYVGLAMLVFYGLAAYGGPAHNPEQTHVGGAR